MLSLSMVLFVGACAGSPETNDSSASDSTAQSVSAVPSEHLPSWLAGLKWMDWLKENYPQWYVSSSPAEGDARPWRDGYDPTRDPVFAHNSLEIAATPHDVLALLRSGRSDTYYPNSSAATDCKTHELVTLALGRAYCWTTFGAEQHMEIVELVDDPRESVIAWEGGSAGVTVYHRWIMRPTAKGTLVITEECERGLLPSLGIYRDRMNPSLHAGHELWLNGMRNQLEGRQP
jgi:hypothetical protein